MPARCEPCKANGTKRQATFGIVGLEGQQRFCSEHKDSGMVQLRSSTCQHGGCHKQSIYGLPGGRKLLCAKHKKQRMTDLVHKPCVHEGCDTRPHFGNPGGKVSHCFKHKWSGMVNLHTATKLTPRAAGLAHGAASAAAVAAAAAAAGGTAGSERDAGDAGERAYRQEWNMESEHPCPRPPRRSAVAESVGGTDVSSDVGRKASEKGKGKGKAKAKGNGAQAPGLKGGKKTPAEPARGKKGASKKSFSSKEWKEGCETEEVAPESKDPDDDQVGCGVDGARDSGGGDVMCLDDANAEKAFTRQSPAKEGAHVTVKLPSSTKKRQGDRQDCGRASGSGVAFPLSSTQQKIGGGEHVDVEVEQSVASMPSTAVETVENVEGGTVGGGSGAGGGEKAGRGRPIGGKASLAERAEAAKINQRFFELQMQYHAQRVAMGKEGISDAAFEATMAGCRVDLD